MSYFYYRHKREDLERELRARAELLLGEECEKTFTYKGQRCDYDKYVAVRVQYWVFGQDKTKAPEMAKWVAEGKKDIQKLREDEIDPEIMCYVEAEQEAYEKALPLMQALEERAAKLRREQKERNPLTAEYQQRMQREARGEGPTEEELAREAEIERMLAEQRARGAELEQDRKEREGRAMKLWQLEKEHTPGTEEYAQRLLRESKAAAQRMKQEQK